MWYNFCQAVKEFLAGAFPRPNYDVPVHTLPMNQDPEPVPVLLWDTHENCRHSVRVICDEEGLTTDQKNDFSSTIHCESGYDNTIIMLNCEKGFVRSGVYNQSIHGAILSKDIGICQINTHWHIGPNKDFPSEYYVLHNIEAIVRWSARVFKISPKTWVCYSKGLFHNYTS